MTVVSGEATLNGQLFVPQYNQSLKKLRSSIDDIRTLVRDSPERVATLDLVHKDLDSATLRENILLSVVLLSGANVLIAIGAVVYVLKDIGKRFQIMHDNSYRLASDLPLSLPMKRADEIGVMDDTFHKMAKALKEATLKERAIIENPPAFGGDSGMKPRN